MIPDPEMTFTGASTGVTPSPRTAPLLANVQLQLVAYHVADALDRSIDKPRNLAKSVTVE